MTRRNLAHDLILCGATASLLLVGPLLDLLLHPDAPLWLPWATMPDVSVYVAMFRRAAEGTLGGDPFVWEHRADPSSIFAVFAIWPRLFGALIRRAGDGGLALAGVVLSTFWFFGLYRLARAFGQEPWRAFAAAGIACFFSVNWAYNLNGYRFHLGAWNLALTEHLRVYPSAASMAIYALAAWRMYAAVSSPTAWRVALAGGLVAGTAIGRPFDWMVLETSGALLVAARFLARRRREAIAAAAIMFLGGGLAAPIILRLARHQTRYAEAFNDVMWRGVYHAKSWTHYGKYTLALAAVSLLLLLAFRRVLGGQRFRTWPLAAVFPCVMVVASLLPYYHTLPKGVTVTGFAYFFVFSFSTWITLALFQLWRFAERPTATCAPRRGQWLPWFLFAGILAQQVALGVFQRTRQTANLIPATLRQVYRWIERDTPPSTVVLARRNGTEVVSETARWLFSPNPAVAALVSPTPTAELLERALWAEDLLGGSLAPLAPLFRPEGVPDYLRWKDGMFPSDRAAVERLERSVGYNTFVFHPRLNRWDLQARGLVLPGSLAGRDDFVGWFRPGLREAYGRVRAAIEANAAPPYKLDLAILGPGADTNGSRLAALGFRRSVFPGGFEVWRREDPSRLSVPGAGRGP